jgi:hypothetical protein
LCPDNVKHSVGTALTKRNVATDSIAIRERKCAFNQMEGAAWSKESSANQRDFHAVHRTNFFVISEILFGALTAKEKAALSRHQGL